MTNAVADSQQSKTDPEGISVAQLAERLGVDPRSLRQWLRAEGKGLGQRGKRYSFTTKQADDLARKWEAAKEASAE